MANITMTIDDNILKKARKLAVEKDTTLTAMIRTHLVQLATRKDEQTERVIAKLKASFDASPVVVGLKNWTREDLHAR